MDTTEINSILEDLDNLRKRMENWLEDQKDQQNQVVPPFIDPIPYTPIVPNPVISKCSQCGLELSQTMGYVCSQPNCPTGLGGPTCNNGTEQTSAITIGKPLC